MDTQKEFEQLIKDALKETGANLGMSADKIAKEMSESAKRLSKAVGQPGFDQAVRAERNIVAMKAGLILADDAASWNARLIGIIQGALRIAAGALV